MTDVPRRATGTVESYYWKDGRTVTWRLRFRAYGQRHRIDLGTNHEGWSAERAAVELEKVMRQVERGTWEPPVEIISASDPAETLHVTISRWWERRKGDLRPATQADYRHRIDLILVWGRSRVTSEMSVQAVDELRDWLSKRKLKRHRKQGNPGTETSATLSPRMVNMVLDVLAQVLDDAVEYGLLEMNPARGRRRRLRVSKGRRSFLEPDQVVDLLDAAGQWESEVPPHQRYGRRAVLATLCLAGLRISELTQADRGDFDLHGGRLRVGGAKTDAGQRDVELTAFLLDELRGHLAAVSGRLPADPLTSFPLFPTRPGGRLNPSNVRNRLLAECVKRANEKRSKAGQLLLPDRVTPHTLRRTFASLAFFAGRDPRWVMGQIGHTDARLTLAVYAQTMQRKRVDGDLVWSLMRFDDETNSPANGPMGRSRASAVAGTLPAE